MRVENVGCSLAGRQPFTKGTMNASIRWHQHEPYNKAGVRRQRVLTMKNHLVFVLPFCVCFSLLLGILQTAHAGRVVDFTILQDGKTILRAHSGDDGSAGPNAVWRYLYTLALHPADGFQFIPERGRPLRMILRGNIRITCKIQWRGVNYFTGVGAR